MSSPFKLGRLADQDWLEHVHAHVWRREPTTGPERIVAAPRDRQVALIRALAERLEEPLVVLYVLLVSRAGHESGRYESPPLDRASCSAFLHEFTDYLEKDGRHHVWILGGDGTLVFDNHQLIYAYGDLDGYEATLRSAGLTVGAPAIPAPHTHNYNCQFDANEQLVLQRSSWERFPLEPSDDP